MKRSVWTKSIPQINTNTTKRLVDKQLLSVCLFFSLTLLFSTSPTGLVVLSGSHLSCSKQFSQEALLLGVCCDEEKHQKQIMLLLIHHQHHRFSSSVCVRALDCFQDRSCFQDSPQLPEFIFSLIKS